DGDDTHGVWARANLAKFLTEAIPFRRDHFLFLAQGSFLLSQDSLSQGDLRFEQTSSVRLVFTFGLAALVRQGLHFLVECRQGLLDRVLLRFQRGELAENVSPECRFPPRRRPPAALLLGLGQGSNRFDLFLEGVLFVALLAELLLGPFLSLFHLGQIFLASQG